MIRATLLLVGGGILVWAATGLPFGWYAGNGHLICSALGTVVCLVPTIATFLLTVWVRNRSLEERMMVILGSVAIRIVTIVGTGVVLTFVVPLVAEFLWTFWGWLLGCYLLSLIVETWAVLIVFKTPINQQ
jgi:uncharacterized membrane protein